MSSYMAKAETNESQWCVIDAKNQTLGRLATRIASRLRGKHRPEFTPHVDTGDFVIVINAAHIKVTGKKGQGEGKIYITHSGRPGGGKAESFSKMIQRVPERVLEIAVKGMLPKGPMGRKLFTKLKIYAGEQHPHSAQQPKIVDLEKRQ